MQNAGNSKAPKRTTCFTRPQCPDLSQKIRREVHKTQNSLLGTERGTDSTRRLETDANKNLYVNIGAISSTAGAVSVLAIGAITGIPASTPSTIVTLTAASALGITKISVSGTDYAKFQLFKNTVLIETKRSGPDRNIDFIFNSPLGLATSDILDVKVTHYNTGVLSDFESTIYGV